MIGKLSQSSAKTITRRILGHLDWTNRAETGRERVPADIAIYGTLPLSAAGR